MFVSIILGGIGNPHGAFAGGLVIRVAQELSLSVVGSEYKRAGAVALVIMIAILINQTPSNFL